MPIQYDIVCAANGNIFYYTETNTSYMAERGEMRVNRFNNPINNNNIVLYIIITLNPLIRIPTAPRTTTAIYYYM